MTEADILIAPSTTRQKKVYSHEEVRDPETGKWKNSKVFCEEGIKFMRNGSYCNDPRGTIGFKEYWDEQLRRCEQGYNVAGWKITGHHYQYLNFQQIEAVIEDEDGTVASKETKMPDFWDGDYDYYWCLEIAKNGLFTKFALASSELEKQIYKTLPEKEQIEEKQRVLKRLQLKVIPHPDFLDGGNHMIVGKSRRKGYSYKNAAICVNTYNTIRNSVTLIGAFDKKYLYPKGTMGMASNYLDFLNSKTAWAKAREFVDRQDHRKASFEEVDPVTNIKSEQGYKSEIIALTFADNPDAARGKDAKYVLFEEAGAFPNLIDSYEATKPGLTAGRFITGQILIFGTGGDMEIGTVDFARMFYSPIEFGLMPFLNIWDKEATGSYCGFFHPVYLNMEGFYDDQGNSDIEGATKYEESVREKLKKHSTSSLVLQKRAQEYPLCPAEAFLTVSLNDFPTVELKNQYNKVVREKLHLIKGQACYLTLGKKEILDENNVLRTITIAKAKPDLDGLLEPIWDYHPKTLNLNGSVVIYEYAIPNAPKGLYKIGFDPYRQQNSTETHPSLGSIYVYKSVQRGSHTSNTIVAEYVGRPYNPDDVNRIAELLAMLYNAEIMYENEVTHVKAYFERRKKLGLLAAQPDTVISKNIKKSKVARVFGCHMNEQLKDAGEKYIKTWLLEVRDYNEHGEAITNLETIYDIGLLEELILYNRKGNFDRVMAFMMVMMQCQEEELLREYNPEEEKHSNAHDLANMMAGAFSNN